MKTIAIAMILLISITTLASCQSKDPMETPSEPPTSTLKTDSEYTDAAKTFVDKLVKLDFDSCVEEFSPELIKAIPKDKLSEVWSTTVEDCGEFLKIEKVEVQNNAGLEAVTVFSTFEKKGVTTVLSYDAVGKLAGIWFNYYEPNANKQPVPEGITEVDVIVGEGTEWPLPGKLTMQGDKQSDSAVVLVHGSGASDMDETIYQNKPFRDIAWGLSNQGIDVLRYDKRTFAYATKMTANDLSHLTVDEETVQDAIAALTLLQEKGYKSVYLAGHSLGGILAPRIQQKSGNKFAGIIVLAGSPRTLIDIVIDQNNAVIATLNDENTIKESNKVVDAEKEKLAKVNELSQEQLLTEMVFGMPAFYVKDMINFDTAAAIKQIDVPIFILQGGKDFQVYADKDFPLWKEALKDKEKVTYQLYDNLNHLFMPSNGAGTVEEYKVAGNIEQKVIDDIAKFIKDN